MSTRMAGTNFGTENASFRKLIGNGLTYRIPRFQRDYSWTENEWEDLWANILDTLDGSADPAHYMGYLVLQSSDDKRFEIIDGQQRLTTLSLIVLAVLKQLQQRTKSGTEADANLRRIEQIRQTYVGYLDPVTLVARPKLTLNRNNNDYYQNHLVPLTHLPAHGLRASEHLLRRAFEWFERQVGQYLQQGSGDEGRQLAQLVEDMADRLFFTVITVTDELNAYKVFETLNARGVRLSSTDLLKNYLFSVLDKPATVTERAHLSVSPSSQPDSLAAGNDTHANSRVESHESAEAKDHATAHTEATHELRNLEDRWETIVGRLQADHFPDFLRAHWNSRHRLARHAELFKTIRQQVTNRADVFSLLRAMEEDLDTWLALTSPETASGWSVRDRARATILKTFRVRQPFSLLLAAHRTLSAEDFSALLRDITVMSLRYNVICSLGTAEQERVYNGVAVQLHAGQVRQMHDILQELSPVYVKDRLFVEAFADKIIRTTDARNARVVRLILCQQERQLSGQAPDFGSDAFNIEHVLPQRAPDGWEGFTHADMEAMTYRLGNMCLLETGPNRAASNDGYAAKRAIYEQSQFSTTRKLAEDNTTWSAERIADRQRWLAKQAKTIWRIAQLS